jgi:hypothetical protein
VTALENSTTFENKCAILAEIWTGYRDDENFEDFIAYNDLGLPLAYMIDSGIVTTTDKCVSLIEDSFTLLLDQLGQEDEYWQSLEDLLTSAGLLDNEE